MRTKVPLSNVCKFDFGNGANRSVSLDFSLVSTQLTKTALSSFSAVSDAWRLCLCDAYWHFSTDGYHFLLCCELLRYSAERLIGSSVEAGTNNTALCFRAAIHRLLNCLIHSNLSECTLGATMDCILSVHKPDVPLRLALSI